MSQEAATSAKKTKQEMMMNDPIPGLVTKMAVPTIIAMLITSFYSLADTYFVGQIGTDATAAVGVVFPLMAVIQAFGFFFGHGSGNAISRRLGAGETRTAEKLASCGIISAITCGILILILGTIFAKPLSFALGSTESMLPYTMAYLKVLLIGAPFLAGSFVLNNQMRFQGNAMRSMIGIASGSILNVILDPILIFNFDMGVEGAALATVIGQAVSLLVLTIGYIRAKCVKVRLSDIRYLPEQFREITAGGLPSLFRQGLASLATVTMNQVAVPFGAAAIAAMSVVGRISFFANSAILGFGQGFQPVCGFNYGAGNYKRVKEAFYFTVKVATVGLLVLSILGFIFAEDLITLFRPDDPEAIKIGTLALRCNCITLPITAWVNMGNMLAQTCKWTAPATILASARQGLCLIPAVLILPQIFGLFGIQVAQAVSDVISFIIATVIYFRVISRLDESKEIAQNKQV